MSQITTELADHIVKLNNEFAEILDNTTDPVSGELRVKMAKAELILFKIAELMKKELNNLEGKIYEK